MDPPRPHVYDGTQHRVPLFQTNRPSKTPKNPAAECPGRPAKGNRCRCIPFLAFKGLVWYEGNWDSEILKTHPFGCGSKNRNSTMGCPGEWKHGPKPAVCPSWLILSHTHLGINVQCGPFGGHHIGGDLCNHLPLLTGVPWPFSNHGSRRVVPYGLPDPSLPTRPPPQNLSRQSPFGLQEICSSGNGAFGIWTPGGSCVPVVQWPQKNKQKTIFTTPPPP